MSEVPLYHRLYTHMPDAQGVPGGRPYLLDEIDAERVLGAAQLRRLDNLLRSMVPPPDGRAWAMCRFAGESADYACLVVSQTARDAQGREGTLTHARLAEVDAGTAMLDLPALADVAEAAPEVGTLEPFAARLGELEPAVPVAAWSVVNVEAYDREEVSAVLAALLAGVPRQPDEAMPATLPGNGGRLRMLVNVWTLLPLVFQRAVVCSLDAQEGARVQVAFSSAPGTLPPEVRERARSYLDWVLERPDDARQWIQSMPGPGLMEFQEELKAALDAFRGEALMAKGNPKTKNQGGEPKAVPQQQGSFDPRLTEFLNEQIAASQESIYDWLASALQSHDIDAEAPTATRRNASARGIPPNAVMAVGAVAMVALLGAGWMWMRTSAAERRIGALERKVVELSQATGVPPPVTEATETAAEPIQDPLKSPESIAGRNWPERFQWVVENRQREIASLITPIAKAAPADRLSDAKYSDIERMVKVLQANRPLTAADRRLLRAYLFELIAAERLADDRKLAIDGAPADVPANLVTRLKEELRIATAAKEPEDADLQSEVVLRWIAQQR